MEVHEAIILRRARRVLDPSRPISDEVIDALVEAMRLSPSCFNNQPYRPIFVHGKEALESLKAVLAKGNEWATNATLIIVIASKPTDDCIIGDRQYFLFDCGLAIGEMMLRATELGLIAHPIAGFNPKRTRELLGIPDEYTVISFIICGYPGTDDSLLSEKQKEAELVRPERKPMGSIFYLDKWGNPLR